LAVVVLWVCASCSVEGSRHAASSTVSGSGVPVQKHQYKCTELMIYSINERKEIEYKGRIDSSDPARPVAEFYNYLKIGDKDYAPVLENVLKKDNMFLSKRLFEDTIEYPC
jgi:hypothetical protein